MTTTFNRDAAADAMDLMLLLVWARQEQDVLEAMREAGASATDLRKKSELLTTQLVTKLDTAVGKRYRKELELPTAPRMAAMQNYQHVYFAMTVLVKRLFDGPITPKFVELSRIAVRSMLSRYDLAVADEPESSQPKPIVGQLATYSASMLEIAALAVAEKVLGIGYQLAGQFAEDEHEAPVILGASSDAMLREWAAEGCARDAEGRVTG